MKNRQRTRQALGKISNFLKSLKRRSGGSSSARTSLRHIQIIPISTKIGKRSLNNPKVFRTNKFNGNFGRKDKVEDKVSQLT